MHHPNTHQVTGSTNIRSTKPALSPYVVEEVALTLSDILRARNAHPGGVGNR